VAALATAEISEKVSRAETGIASLAVGGAILFAGFLVLLAAAVGGLAQVLPPDYAAWLAPLIVGVVVAVIGWILLAQGRGKLKANDLKLSRTGRSLRRDTELAKAHITGEHAK
jgi:xanthine/uracil permease